MTTYAVAHDALRSHWHANWGDRTKVAWDNMKFVPPNPPVPWVRVTVQDFGGRRASIGPHRSSATLYRVAGLVTVSVFSPVAKESMHYALVEAATHVWRGAAIPGVRLQDVGARDVGITDEIWWMTNIRAGYTYDQRGDELVA